MRGKEMLDAVGYVDSEWIEKGETSMKKNSMKQWVAIAACVCLILGGVVWYRSRLPQYATEMLSLSDLDISMGYEEYRAYDIEELRRENPLDGTTVKALSVYRNTISYDERQYPYGQDLEAMKTYLLTLAEKFGLASEELEIFDNAPDEGQMLGLQMEFASRGLDVPEYYTLPYTVYVETETVRIEVSADMSANIRFMDGVSLPESYCFTNTSTPDELIAAGEYLWSLYGDIIGYEDPQVCVIGGDYSTNGTQSYVLSFYEGSCDKAEKLENYSLNRVEFLPDENGKLKFIRIYSDEALEKIGLYPIISEEKAREQLLDGQYYTSVTEEFPGESAVMRCELVYRTGGKDKILMPFYRFYVLLEDAPGADLYPEGMQAYGAYYVPAVDPAYLETE